MFDFSVIFVSLSIDQCFYLLLSFCHFAVQNLSSYTVRILVLTIFVQQLALESVRTEYANAQLECSAADERAKVLAAEVILLEDKVVCYLFYFVSMKHL